ncbi:hypothetical protein CGCS363_v006386 [Colletotrichum siamense]|uniref:uncharacterized protein n=1 Tax=Colletotrichum siamense TaxID=690259 RepID=UPI00187243DC|nr:uncharacterized protein CGCS363_v006386 [Colletotrichum siamense]KAF5501204.1 hypothetical protein CGCS363_v006386 [Colletotrichum siamense]
MLFLAVLLFTTVPLVSSQFLNPSQSRELWRIGQTRKVQYNTKLEKYTIALWQQAIAGGSATLGPIIVETTTGPKREFEWKVDLEELDLGASNVFFFWLFEGDKSVQGQVKKGQAFSSAFFNITDEPEPSSSSSIKSSTTRTSASFASSSEASSTSLASTTTEVELTTTTSEAPTTTQVRVLPTAQEPGPTYKTKAGDASASNVPEVSVADPNSLSVGAQAGIGVGVGLVGVTCVVCVMLWYRYLKKKQQTISELHGSTTFPQLPGYSRSHGVGGEDPESPVDKPGYYVNKRPVEID